MLPAGLRIALGHVMPTTLQANFGEVRRAARVVALYTIALLLLTCGATAPVYARALPHNIPDFTLDAARTTIRSTQSGDWSSASTWAGGQTPNASHIVHIDPAHVVTISTTSAAAHTIAVHGTLRFSPSVATRLTVTNLMVMGDHGMPSMSTVGSLEVGTAAAPIAANVTAEIIIANTATGGGVADPEQFGTGLLNFGKMTMHGSVKTPTFVRLAAEPRAGHTTLTLSEVVTGWKVGDRVVLPDTRHIKETEVTGGGWINTVNQWEERTVQAISGDGLTVTLNSGLTYDHLGARDLNGVLNYLPHVGNLTRNVVVRSESATGTRGHVISVHIADTDVRYALFRDLGRTRYTPLNTTTNLIGRYPIHMHHNRGPIPSPANGYQFTLIGNAVDGGSVETQFKWGIAVHNSHYGLIQDNVVYNYNGSGVATEDGSESFNVFDHNFALRGIGEPNNSVSEARMAMGTEGVGFWFRGPNNYVRRNVAANYQNPTTEAAYGFAFLMRFLGTINVPNFKGADTSVAGQFTTRNGNGLPLLQFEDNEAYGAMQGGMTIWWAGSQDPAPIAGAPASIVKDVKLWHIYNKTVYMYPAQKVIFDGLTIRGNFSSASRCCGNGIYFADYSSKGIVVRNSDIQGMEEGITAPEAGFGPEPQLTIENTFLRNYTNVAVPTNGSVNGCWMDNKLVTIINTRFEAPPGRSLSAVSMVRDVASAPECLSKLDEVKVYAYNGDSAVNFQVYHSSSSVLPRPPGSCTPTTRTGISGPTCPIAPLGAVVPTVTLSALPVSIPPGQSTTLTWSTTSATSVSINQGVGTVGSSGSTTVTPAATTTYTITATNASGSATATATVTVSIAPTASLSASPLTLTAGQSSTLSWTTTNATSVSINQGIGTVAASGTRTVSPASTTTYTLTASNGGSSVTATATVTVNAATGPHNKDRANAYDDVWQNGAAGWVANARAILAGGTGQVPGMVLWIGDSLTRDTAMGAWAQNGNGKTAEDQAITTWMHAGSSPQSVDSIDGFALAAPYICSARSYTVGDGLGSWHFMGSSMPTDTNPTTAKQKLQNCTSYPNALNLRTMLAALPKAQFAIPEVNLDAAHPGSFPDFEAMVDLLISKNIVPIIITYTYRTDAAFNLLVDQYNTALIQYAQNKKLPLIDFNREMLLRLPFSQWPGRFLSDGVHYTRGNSTYPATSSPYANGGDPATHTTGLSLTYNGYGLKGWLGVQKMKEIKQLVVDGLAPTPPTATLGASPASITAGQSSTLTWATTNATTVSINQGVGTVAASGTLSVSPGSTTSYTITATNAGGSVTATATVTVTAALPLPTATLSAAPPAITASQSSVLTWSTSGATSVSINQGIGTVATSGTRSVSPLTTTSYTLTATNAAGSVTATASVTVNPPTVRKASPADAATVPTPMVTLSWQGNPVATAYEYCVDTTNNGTCDTAWVSTGNSAIVDVNGLPSQTQHYWQVRAQTPAGVVTGDGGTWWRFTTATLRLARLVHPITGLTLSGARVTFAWDPGLNITEYSLWVGLTPGGGEIYKRNESGLLRKVAGVPIDGRMIYVRLWSRSAGGWGYRDYEFQAATIDRDESSVLAVAGDYDGDRKADHALWLGDVGLWYFAKSSTGNHDWVSISWGNTIHGDRPVPGDYDGDGKTDPAVWRASDGNWYVLKSSTNYTGWTSWHLGTAGGHQPVAGDFDGDGKTDPAVWESATGVWQYLASASSNQLFTVQWGRADLGDRPVPGDYDGDGRTDPAIWRGPTGDWFWLRSATGYAQYGGVSWGRQDLGDQPAPADYDGDGKTDPAIWRGLSGDWYWLRSATAYAQFGGAAWGRDDLGDVPMADDYDGDGKADPAVWRGRAGDRYVLTSSSNYAGWFGFRQ